MEDQSSIARIAASLERSGTESPASMTAKVISPNGFEWLMTIRNGKLTEMVKDVDKLEKWLMENNWQPAGNYRAPAPPQAPPPTDYAEREAELNPHRTPPPVAGSGQPGGDSLSFPAETLVATMHQGKTYWKVQGGQFSKYGVTIWPEVLTAAGFFLEDLNPAETYDLRGHTAYYELTDEGKPSKVRQLVKA